MDKIIQKNIHDGEICIITLNRPDVLNSLNRSLVEAILKSIEECQDDKSIRSIILTGNGRGFCAGADLAGGDWPIEEGWSSGKSTANAMEVGFNPLVRSIVSSKKPVISAINGIAAGGGVGLALCADIVIAAESAKFKLVFAPQLGIIPDVGASWLVPNLIGRAKANGLALLGDDLDAKTAYNWGLIWKCVPDDELLDIAISIAKRISDSAIRGLKAVVAAHDHALISTLDQQLDYERDTQEYFCDQDEFKEGVKAFIEKRKPNFRDIKNVDHINISRKSVKE